MLTCKQSGGADSHPGVFMRVKPIAVVVIVAASAALFVAMQHENRADAANGNCYMADSGPSTPTICN